MRRCSLLAAVVVLVAVPAASAAPESKRCVSQVTAPEKLDLSRAHWRAVIWMDVRVRSRLGPAMLYRPVRRGLSASVRPGIRRVNVTLPRRAGPGRYRLALRFACGKRRQVVRRTIRLVP